ncbi:MAG: hypothetical protein HZB50_19155 [Chloroflexi bacterium]|nr:hypothetical protein [Chloroflexota bacterium]
MNISSFLSVSQPCDKALQWTKKQLSQENLRCVQTFDLHSARMGPHDCGCQLVILLVFGKTAEPVTLILQGKEGRTWFSIADISLQNADAKLINAIQQALEIGESIPVLKS